MKQRVKIILGIVFLFLMVSYTLFAVSEYLEGPKIEVSFPVDGYSTSSPSLRLLGVAEHVNFLSLNDRQIFVDEKGRFSEVLLLPRGPSIIELHGKDRYDREITRLIRVMRVTTNQ